MLTLASVQAMKRPELQSLCKEIGHKANGKTEALLAAIIKHFNLDNESAAPQQVASSTSTKSNNVTCSSSIPATTTSNKKVNKDQAAPVTPAAPSSSFEEDQDEDEMRLEVPAQKKVAGKKPAGRTAAQLSLTALNATPAPVAQQIVYATSPGTKDTIATLLSTVRTLQYELNATHSALTKLEDIVSALPAPVAPSPALKEEDVATLVHDRLAEFRTEMYAAMDKRVKEMKGSFEELKAAIPAPRELGQEEAIKDLFEDLVSQAEATHEWKAGIEAALDSLRSSVVIRAPPSTLPASPAPQALLHTLPQTAPSPTPSTLSLSDAPPTQTLGDFSSPSSPAAATPPSLVGTPSSSLSRRSPRKLPSNSHLPALASALPSHMLAAASPRSPRGRGRSSTISAATPQQQPQSPARPVIATPSLGKHARESDASELSFVVPEKERRSPEKGDGHQRKRMRVSETGSFEDEDQQEEEEADTTASTEGSFSEATSQVVEQQSLAGALRVQVQVQERDFLAPTKTGSPPSASPSDPSFFSFSFPSRSPAPAPAATPSSARKSLPMTSLPFPLLSASPYTTTIARKSSADTPVRKSLFGGDASNLAVVGVAPTPMAARTLYGSEREGSFFDTDGMEGGIEEQGSRFDDVSVELSPRKVGWGGGMFGRA